MSNNVSLIIVVGSMICIILFIIYELRVIKKAHFLKEKGAYEQFSKCINKQFIAGWNSLIGGTGAFTLWILLYYSPFYRNPVCNLFLAWAILGIVGGIFSLVIYYRLKSGNSGDTILNP